MLSTTVIQNRACEFCFILSDHRSEHLFGRSPDVLHGAMHAGAFNSKRLFAPKFAVVIPNRFPILFGWQKQVALTVVFVGNPDELSKPAESRA